MSFTSETLQLVKDALASPNEALAKSITTSTNLVAYDLQAPAKNLYPVFSPLRNSLPRVGGGVGLATNWKAVNAITGSGVSAMGWVPEGQRSGRMSYTTSQVAASYRTIGEEDNITEEAKNAAVSFEDAKARMVLRLLQQTMIKEEHAILGGNSSLALGTPVTPTLSAAGSGATLPAATYSVIVVALTYEGMQVASVSATGLPGSKTITGADGKTYTLNGGNSNKSANATQAVTLGQTLTASTTPIAGALGYAWYVGTAGSEILQAITATATTTFSAPLATGTQAATAITGDNSTNSNLAFDGLLTTAFKSGGYINQLANGAKLTASSKGSINEIDTMLLSMWNTYKVSPTVLYVAAQQQQDITAKVLTSASAPLLRYNSDGKDPYALVANGVVEYYYNPFALDGGTKIPVKIHPFLPAGTIIGWAGNLPTQYQSNEVPNVAEVKTRRDYYQIDWPQITRTYDVGVYAEEVLAIYAPFAMGVLGNITAG